MIGASLPPGPGPAAVATPEQAAASAGAGKPPRTGGDAAAANAPSQGTPQKAPRDDAAQLDATTQPGATAHDREAGVDAPPRGFAELLAASGTLDANAGAATREPASAAPDASAQSATNALPDQLLALLIGDWAPSPRPTPTAPPDAALGGRARGPTPQLQAVATAPALPLAAPPTATADAGGEGFAALAKLAADALGAAAGSADRSGAQIADAASLPDGLAPATASPVAAPARTGAPIPAPAAALAMPADPEAGFDAGFGTRIAWMAEQRIGHAEIRLNPEHVGPIDVRVQLDGNRVSAEFHSAHAEVRRAIEASMPQLREMLGQHGLQLGHADVGQRNAQGQPAPHAAVADATGERGRDDDTAGKPSIAPTRTRGLLDEYA